MIFVYYMMTGIAIFAIKFGLQPEWREYLHDPDKPEDNIATYFVYTIGYAIAWPFISLALYFWKDSDETGKTSDDSK